MSRPISLPLQGLTVLDLTELLPGPYATLQLAEMGARVIKIERPSGDSARTLSPGMFRSLNRGKLTMGLDLKRPEGVAMLAQMAACADVLIEGFRPGVMQRLQLDAGVLRARNPRLIYLSLSGYGQTGPLRDHPGHDMNYAAVAGLSAISGTADGPPAYDVGVPIGDMAGAMFAVVAILAALLRRQQTGEGGYLDVSITDSLLGWMTPRLGAYDHFRAQDAGDFKGHLLARPGYGIFETADGRHIALGALETPFWKGLVKALALEQFCETRYDDFEFRCDHAAQIASEIRRVLKGGDVAHWQLILDHHDVPYSVVSTLDETLNCGHFLQRGVLSNAEGSTRVRFPVEALRAPDDEESPVELSAALNAWLRDTGVTPEDVNRLRDSGILFDLAAVTAPQSVPPG